MNQSYIKLFVFFLFPTFVSLTLGAQDYLTGKIISGNSDSRTILYDRTQNALAKNIFQSAYKVLDNNKNQLYSVSLTNDKGKSIISVSMKIPGSASPILNNIKYERTRSGLIFTDRGNMDTSFEVSGGYKYLISFTDTARDYPVLHRITAEIGKEIFLDPLTKLRLRKHRELVIKMIAADPGLQKEMFVRDLRKDNDKEQFNAQLILLREDFYKSKGMFDEQVLKFKNRVDDDISVLFRTKRVYSDAKRYEGEKKKGTAEGTGLFMSNGNYYDGLFSDGKFVSGVVIIHYEASEYCGEYSMDSLNGTGWLKFRDESYLLGKFRDGVLNEGIILVNDRGGETYFGTFKNGSRTGYGQLHNTKGEMYLGHFINGKMMRGYAKEIDPFGNITYARIETKVKTSVDTKDGEEIFNILLGVKK